MNYELLKEASTAGHYWALWISVVIAAAGVIFAIIQLAAESENEKLKNRAIFGSATGVIGIIVMLVSFYNVGEAHREAQQQNLTAATSNLKTKYDIKAVEWNAKETTTSPTSTTGNGEITVEANDGRLYIFKYRTDLASGEPFLKDMPIPGGSVPEQAVTAASLLK